jgi:hypothetical protein
MPGMPAATISDARFEVTHPQLTGHFHESGL